MTSSHKSPDPRQLSIGGGEAYLRLASEETHGQFALLDFTLPAGTTAPGPHYHKHHDESYAVMSGHLRFYVDAEEIDLLAGESIFVSRGVLHNFEVVGGKPAHFQLIITPGGFERFFEELAHLESTGVPDLGAFTALCERYNAN